MYLSTMYCMNVIWVFLPEINFTYLLTSLDQLYMYATIEFLMYYFLPNMVPNV